MQSFLENGMVHTFSAFRDAFHNFSEIILGESLAQYACRTIHLDRFKVNRFISYSSPLFCQATLACCFFLFLQIFFSFFLFLLFLYLVYTIISAERPFLNQFTAKLLKVKPFDSHKAGKPGASHAQAPLSN
jgi:hypothetical protein